MEKFKLSEILKYLRSNSPNRSYSDDLTELSKKPIIKNAQLSKHRFEQTSQLYKQRKEEKEGKAKRKERLKGRERGKKKGGT